MDNKLQTQVLALAMQIIGIKDPGQFKQAMTMMSEQGRAKFLTKCAEIIQSGDMSEENIAQAQQEAQQAIQEGQQGQQAILAKYGNRITYLNRFYSGGSVRTFDGNYMKLKKPLNKDQVEGREPIGMYKGQWMYLNGDKIAVPNQHGKQKGEDGSTHINRAYNGMLIPKPDNYIQQYSIGGIFSSIGNWVKGAASNVKNVLNTGAKWVNKNQNILKAFGTLIPAATEFFKGVTTSNVKNPIEASAHIQNSSYLQNQAVNYGLQGLQDLQKYKSEQASKNGSPQTQKDESITLDNQIKANSAIGTPPGPIYDPTIGKTVSPGDFMYDSVVENMLNQQTNQFNSQLQSIVEPKGISQLTL